MNEIEKTYVNIGRELIALCEQNRLFGGDDEESLTLWNAAVTAGNKFVTYGMVWTKFTGIDCLSAIEKSAVKQYLDQTFKGGIHFSRICESNKENNNFKGTQESFSAIKLHVTRISEIIEFIKPEKEDRNDLYTLLNKINPNYFK